ncbi:hypothetical protein NSK11_contig00092-0024 [Nocardia seriolae]|uniref:Uncharacterized protein n=1 Tax=Nocardia seriolae TaxID=37332 RepID=A0ABC9YZF3_9NOCA|nr:hypothetical protein NSERKGN1266_04880 [Nocardia seriolae]BEK92493.1 hypothetical protein NSER024013_03990 [Nocardia seriolae]GAM48734.1 hypothetical protein NS07_v2contig00085-0023 [Nocardia seriolae]GAP30722.1 hypothetical protein NSK11_contig00092-0024 [Nocardia seriolae]GEM26306.1 hypothetical protein NS2_45450 [Nocardia seriolae NBRC 15557]
MGQAQAGAGEHGHDGLGDHGHVDGDAVTGHQAQTGQVVGGARDLGQQFGIGDGAGIARLALPMDGDLLAAPVQHVPVHTVVGDIQLAVREPLGEGRVTPVQDLGEGLMPVQPLRLFGPEPIAIGGGSVVERGIAIGCGRELSAGRIHVQVVGRGFRGHLVSSSLACRPRGVTAATFDPNRLGSASCSAVSIGGAVEVNLSEPV